MSKNQTKTVKLAVDDPSPEDGVQAPPVAARPAPRRRIAPTLKPPVDGGQPTVGAQEVPETAQDAPSAPKGTKTRAKATKPATTAPAAPGTPAKPKVQRGVKVHEVPGKTTPPGETKADIVIRLLKRKEGATLQELQDGTGWQAHSVRGFLAGTLKKKGVHTTNEKIEGRGRVYRVDTSAATTTDEEAV